MSIKKSLMVFDLGIVVIDRKNGHERGADISTTLAALSTKIDLGILYEGLDEGNTHYLISLVNLNIYFNIYATILKSFWCL